MEFSVIKSPGELNWSGNPISYTLACAPYGSYQQAQDIRLQVTIQVEDFRATNVFRDIKTEVLTPGANGIINYDISSFTDPFLKYVIPPINTLATVLAESQSKKFRISWRPYINGELGVATATDPVIVCKGGLPYDGERTFDRWLPEDKKIICLNTDHLMHPHSPFFGSFLYMGVDVSLANIWCYRTVNSVDLLSKHGIPFDLKKGDIFFVPVTKLADQSVGDVVDKIRLIFKEDDDTEIDEHSFFYEQNLGQRISDLIFVNSTGGLDSLRLFGEYGPSGSYQQSLISLAASSRVNKNSLPSKVSEGESSAIPMVSANTGFILEKDEDILKALMLHQMAFEIEFGRYKPIIVTKKTLSGPVSTDFIYSAQIEWREANEHRYFSQLSMGGWTEGTCPALLRFTAAQENSTSIRINWSCPNPYEKVQVKISNGTPEDDVLMEVSGQFGTQVINIEFVGNITVTGRLICGLNTSLLGNVTLNLGPATVVTIELALNLKPVAVNDQLEISSGFSTAQLLAGNILSNDYDPDGDEIEIAPDSDITLQGGTYTITVDGRVYYKPPSVGFTGIDSFNYKVREVATPTSFGTGTVFIKVLAGSASEIVYAKIVLLNQRTSGGLTADVVIKTFADVLCTIAKDVSLMGISFSYNKNVKITNMNTSSVTSNTDTSGFVAGAGVQTMILQDARLRFFYSSGAHTFMEETTYTLTPGNGYIIS